jgi:hydrogenase expression/formation protein HypE
LKRRLRVSNLPEIGKISSEIFDELIYPRLGVSCDSVLVGPEHGVDTGIVRIGDKAVSFTTDPVFIVPEYGWKRSAWFAINILLSDSVTSGLKPKYLSIDLNLPMEMTKAQLDIIWEEIHKECDKIGVSIITGHTGRYEGCHYPMVGGATVVGVGNEDEYVGPDFAKAGDKVIITKGPAIEATGIFAAMFPEEIEKEFGLEFRLKAEEVFYKMSVVDDAFVSVAVGVRDNGVSAMHDATECGILGGLFEMTKASGLGIRVNKEDIVIEQTVKDICRYFKIDPYSSISEGTLILFARENRAEEVLQNLKAYGIMSSIVGELTEADKGFILVEDGIEKMLRHPVTDPFWDAFYRALERSAERGI